MSQRTTLAIVCPFSTGCAPAGDAADLLMSDGVVRKGYAASTFEYAVANRDAASPTAAPPPR